MSDKVHTSQPFEIGNSTYATTVTNGEISSISVLDSNGNYKPVVPNSEIFNEAASNQNSLDTLSVNRFGQPGLVTEPTQQSDEQLQQNYDNLKKSYDNGEFVTDSAENEETREYFGDTSQYPSTAPPDTMRYPYDIDIAQDHLTIKQYKYVRKLSGGKVEVNESGPGGSVAGSQYTKPFGKFVGGVILPMPKVSDSNGAEWGKSDLNVLGIGVAMAGAGLMQGVINPSGMFTQMQEALLGEGKINKNSSELDLTDRILRNIDDDTNIMQETGVAGMAVAAEKLAGTAGIDITADELLARSTGTILNPNAELLFQGPVLRDFGFKFLMVARSEAEAKMIRRIIRFFKIGSAPIHLGGPALLRTPNIFQLEYKAGSKTLDTVNRFNEMALRTITVDYAPDGFWSAYQDSHPVAVVMSLQFSELRPIYQREHRDNTSEDSVGY